MQGLLFHLSPCVPKVVDKMDSIYVLHQMHNTQLRNNWAIYFDFRMNLQDLKQTLQIL